MGTRLLDPPHTQPVTDQIEHVMTAVAGGDPTPERLPAIGVREWQIRPINLASVDDLVEASEDVLVCHVDRNLQIEGVATPRDLGDRALAFEKPRSPCNVLRRCHEQRVPPTKRSV